MNDFGNPLVWIDLEMTGLNPDIDKILELAFVITDGQLNTIETGHMVVHQNHKVLSNMNEWSTVQHNLKNREGGTMSLVDLCKDSKTTTEAAENYLCNIMDKYRKYDEKLVLAGSSVWCDKAFLLKYMPKLDKRVHHQIVDVSCIKQIAARWFPFLIAPPKKNNHKAVDDIFESIALLNFYKNTIFIAPGTPYKQMNLSLRSVTDR